MTLLSSFRKSLTANLGVICALGMTLLPLLSACSSFRAKPAEKMEFLTKAEGAKMTEQRTRFPFNKVWISPEARARKGLYKNIYVAEVNTERLVKMDWWQAQSVKTKKDLNRDRLDLGKFAHATFYKAFQEDGNRRLNVVRSTQGRKPTVILELAITELIPAKAWMSAAATAAAFVVPGAQLLGNAGSGSIAIEGRVRDAETNKVLFMFADREADKSALLNLAGLQFYAGSKDNIKDWANQCVELVNTPPTETVEDSDRFKLITW